MKVALITTAPSVRSGIGDYTRHLLPYLREHCDVRLFVAEGLDDEAWGDEKPGLVSELEPNDFDQVVYQLGNEINHAFMPRMIRAIGGTVVQHDWVLFDMALTAFPGLQRGGAKGHALALREGGFHQAQVYGRNWLARRRQRKKPEQLGGLADLPGSILAGWHEAEDNGLWSADQAVFRIPAQGVRNVQVDVHVEPGRTVHLRHGDAVVGYANEALVLELGGLDRPVLTLETAGIAVTAQQRRHGDSRRLGSFVKSIAWTDAEGRHELDLSEPASVPILPISLSRDRFSLPLNHSVVRFADAFLVHSDYVAQLILHDRNTRTAIGKVHHGSEFLWRDEERSQSRRRFDLPASWIDGFLVTSFGGVQPHKRIDKALEALALARRERNDIHMVLAGSLHSGEFDPKALVKKLGLEEAVRFTGYVPEDEGREWLHAGDVALNLRGPSSGGTSGGIFQAFSMGRPVIASDAAEQRELPDACVVRVPLGTEEIPTLARHLVELRDHPDRIRNLEQGVRRFVKEECHWGVVAKTYAQHLAEFPVARASRRKLLSMRAEMKR